MVLNISTNIKALLGCENSYFKGKSKMSNKSMRIAQRYGKGRAANESETKPPNPDKNETPKPPTGGASHLTGLLDEAASAEKNTLSL